MLKTLVLQQLAAGAERNASILTPTINASPDRYVDMPLAFSDLGITLAQAGLTLIDSRQLGRRLIQTATLFVETNPEAIPYFNPFLSGGTMSFTDPFVRLALPELVTVENGTITAQDLTVLQGVIATLDTFAGDFTNQEVEAVLLEIRKDELLATYVSTKNTELQTATESLQATRNSDIVDFTAALASWDGTGDPPEGV